MAMWTTVGLRFLKSRTVILAHCRFLLLSVTIFPFQSLLSAQAASPVPPTKPPQLQLEITSVKRTYFVGETLFVKYKLTSLADGTLCFPPPIAEAQVFDTGYLTTDATQPTSDERDRFIEVFDARHPTDDELRNNVTSKWIKLGMSEPYQPKPAGRVTVLTEPGQWTLRSTYHPPELNSREKSIVESLACSVPDVEVHSASVTITVTNAPE
jgi:hypothetical protein